MSFIAKYDQLLKIYIKIWEKIEELIKINFESKPVYGDDVKYITTNMNIYAGGIITNFHYKKAPKEKPPCKCLSVIIIQKVLSSNIFRRMQIYTRNNKN